MTRVIYKALIEPYPGPKTIPFYKGAEILSIAEQYGKVAIWYLCDPTLSVTPHNLVVVWTGQDFDLERVGAFIGTVSLSDGDLVCHIFHLALGQNQ